VTWIQTTVAANQIPLEASCPSTTSCVVATELVGQHLASLDSTTTGSIWHSKTVPLDFVGIQVPLASLGLPSALSCTAAGFCWFSELQDLLTSTNGGATWKPVAPPTYTTIFDDVVCVTASSCNAVVSDVSDARSYLRQTINGGATWSSPLALPSSATSAMWLACTDLSHCVAISSSLVTSHAYATANGGSSWSVVSFHVTVPTGGLSAVATLSCSTTACLVELQAENQRSVSEYQLLRMTP
jgi:hypothetical protein